MMGWVGRSRSGFTGGATYARVGLAPGPRRRAGGPGHWHGGPSQPNPLPFPDAQLKDDCCYIVQDFIPGGTLKRVVAAQRGAPDRTFYTHTDASRWARDIARGLAFLHGANPVVCGGWGVGLGPVWGAAWGHVGPTCPDTHSARSLSHFPASTHPTCIVGDR